MSINIASIACWQTWKLVRLSMARSPPRPCVRPQGPTYLFAVLPREQLDEALAAPGRIEAGDVTGRVAGQQLVPYGALHLHHQPLHELLERRRHAGEGESREHRKGPAPGLWRGAGCGNSEFPRVAWHNAPCRAGGCRILRPACAPTQLMKPPDFSSCPQPRFCPRCAVCEWSVGCGGHVSPVPAQVRAAERRPGCAQHWAPAGGGHAGSCGESGELHCVQREAAGVS